MLKRLCWFIIFHKCHEEFWQLLNAESYFCELGIINMVGFPCTVLADTWVQNNKLFKATLDFLLDSDGKHI